MMGEARQLRTLILKYRLNKMKGDLEKRRFNTQKLHREIKQQAKRTSKAAQCCRSLR